MVWQFVGHTNFATKGVFMRIGISADSTCDIPLDLIKKYNIKLMPMIITLDTDEYQDGIDITQEKLYEYIERTGNLAKTAARSTYEYVEHFESMLAECDKVIHFSLSFKISSTGNNARLASEEIGNGKVAVIDSKSLTTGQGLLVLSAAEKVAKGQDFDSIVTEAMAEVDKIQASFLVDTLKYLHKGGRCSSLALLGANILKIKPRISLVDGEMKVTKKYMGGIEPSLVKYVNDMLKECPPNKKRVFVAHSSQMPVVDKICQMLKDYGFEEVISNDAGPTICTHCGKNTCGILYVKE